MLRFLGGRRLRWLLPPAIALLVVVGVLGWRRPVREQAPAFPPPRLSSSSFLNATAEAAYTGIAACARCHPGEHRSYRKTAHSLALSEVVPTAEPTDGRFFHARSGQTYTVFRKGGQLHHQAAVLDSFGAEYVKTDFPLRYLIGSGRHTRSYLVEVDGFLSESPLTWYASKHTWSMSPGYDRAHHRGFERPADVTCLFCHVGRTAPNGGDFQRLTILEQPIGCERCHGPGSLHVAEETAIRAGAKAESERTPTIVHPAKLSRPLREALCAQCHLNADSAVHVRGRSLLDFRPGLPLSDFCINYRLDSPAAGMTVVGHVEQLHLSRCYQSSEKLTCTTCHDPHADGQPSPRRYRKVCTNCHGSEGCRLERGERLHRSPENDCVSCHMPRVGTDIPHIAFTHHRIGIHSAREKTHPAGPARVPALVPCDDVSWLAEIDRDRNLGLAYFELAQRQASAQAAHAYRTQAASLLRGVRSRGLRDGEVAAALARLAADSEPRAALDLAHEALAHKDLSVKYRVNTLFLIGDVGLRLGRLDDARQALEQLTVERRASEDWLRLGQCRQRGGDLRGALGDIEKAAAIAPFREDVRARLAEVHERLGNPEAAQREASIAARLATQPGG